MTVTYHSADVLAPFMRSLLVQQHQDFLLFAVDNASSDRTRAVLGEFTDPRIRLILNDSNAGFAEGGNQGICAALAAGCDEIVLLNNDTEFGPELLARLHGALQQYECEMVCPKILVHDTNRIWDAGGGFTSWLGYRISTRGQGEVDRGQYNRAERQEFAPCCCVLFRKDVFERVGLFDPAYFVYGEDVDFFYRAQQAKLTMFYEPAAVMTHKAGSLTGGRGSPFVVRFATRNRVYFVLKHQKLWFSAIFLAGYGTYILLSALTGGHRTRLFPLRLRAFLEGIRLARNQKASRKSAKLKAVAEPN